MLSYKLLLNLFLLTLSIFHLSKCQSLPCNDPAEFPFPFVGTNIDGGVLEVTWEEGSRTVKSQSVLDSSTQLGLLYTREKNNPEYFSRTLNFKMSVTEVVEYEEVDGIPGYNPNTDTAITTYEVGGSGWTAWSQLQSPSDQVTATAETVDELFSVRSVTQSSTQARELLTFDSNALRTMEGSHFALLISSWCQGEKVNGDTPSTIKPDMGNFVCFFDDMKISSYLRIIAVDGDTEIPVTTGPITDESSFTFQARSMYVSLTPQDVVTWTFGLSIQSLCENYTSSTDTDDSTESFSQTASNTVSETIGEGSSGSSIGGSVGSNSSNVDVSTSGESGSLSNTQTEGTSNQGGNSTITNTASGMNTGTTSMNTNDTNVVTSTFSGTISNEGTMGTETGNVVIGIPVDYFLPPPSNENPALPVLTKISEVIKHHLFDMLAALGL